MFLLEQQLYNVDMSFPYHHISIVGPGGAGKSTLGRRLRDILHLPLYPLDNIFWKKDKSHIERSEFDKRLDEILKQEEWIIDGDYSRTYKVRLEKSDLIIFLDFPLEDCLKAVEGRVGKVREDIPWVEDTFDPEFKEWIINWFKDNRPELCELLEQYKDTKTIKILKNRKEIDDFCKEIEGK